MKKRFGLRGSDPARPKLPVDKCWLYAVASINDLARRLDVPKKELEALIADTRNFKIFEIDGRAIQEPKTRLQRLHGKVHRHLSNVQTPDYLHSAVRGRSYVTNGTAHLTGAVVKIDVQRFFRSVPRRAIYQLFKDRFNCAGDVAGLLANLLTFDRHLATGSSASPILSYYAYKDMFDEAYQLAASIGATMTCYVDDIAISGGRVTPSTLHEVRKIIARHGLRGHKAKYFDSGSSKIVTGVAIVGGRAALPNRRHLKIKQLFDQLGQVDDYVTKQKIMTRLVSHLHEAAQVDPAWRAKALNVQADRRRLEAEQRLL